MTIYASDAVMDMIEAIRAKPERERTDEERWRLHYAETNRFTRQQATTLLDRLRAMADEQDRLVRRFTYLGGRDPNSKLVAAHAAKRRAHHEQAARDLREAIEAVELRNRAAALLKDMR